MKQGQIQRSAGKPDAPLQLLDKVKAYQRAARAEGLPPAERVLLLVLTDELAGWGRVSGVLTNEELTTRCSLSARTLRRARTELERRGLIEVVFAGHANRYRLMALTLPKRMRQAGTGQRALELGDAALADLAGQGGQICTGPNTNIPQQPHEAGCEPVPPPAGGGLALPGARAVTPEEAVARVEARSAKRRKADVVSKSLPAVERTWREAHAEHKFPVPVYWVGPGAGRWGAQAKNLIATFPGSASDLHAFVAWVVAEWCGRVKARLSWMKDYPREPSVGIVLRQIEALVAEWRGQAGGAGEQETAQERRRRRWGGGVRG